MDCLTPLPIHRGYPRRNTGYTVPPYIRRLRKQKHTYGPFRDGRYPYHVERKLHGINCYADESLLLLCDVSLVMEYTGDNHVMSDDTVYGANIYHARSRNISFNSVCKPSYDCDTRKSTLADALVVLCYHLLSPRFVFPTTEIEWRCICQKKGNLQAVRKVNTNRHHLNKQNS